MRADTIAGLTVAIVALPLSMAIAIASGATPAQGLYTAIVGGFIVSPLGGSRFQIGGPAGAFIVLVAATVAQHGMDGLILATFLSGIDARCRGVPAARHLHQVHSVPGDGRLHAGIAVIIFASQIKELLGLTRSIMSRGNCSRRCPALWEARASVSPAAVALSAGRSSSSSSGCAAGGRTGRGC